MSNLFKNNEAIVHQTNEGELTVFPKNSIWYKIGFDTNMVTFRSRYNDEVIFYENDVTELTIDGELPENFVTDFNKIAYGGGKPEITDYDLLCTYNVTSTTQPTKLFGDVTNISSMYIDDEEVPVGANYNFDKTGERTVKIKLNDVTFSSSVFYSNTNITTIVIGDNVQKIAANSFFICSNLNSVTFGKSVSEILGSAFYGCKNLANIVFVSTEKPTIGNMINYNSVFNGISSTGSLSYPCESDYSSVTSLSAFANWEKVCIGSEEPEEPSEPVITDYDLLCTYNVTSTTEATSLSYNTNLTKNVAAMYIDNEQVEIGNACTFDKVGEHVVKYKLVDNTTIGNNAFNKCSGLTEIVIPNSVTKIGSGAFLNCSGLTEIVIPNSVTSIGDYAFQYCSGLTSVTIPNSVTSIGDRAFQFCNGLTSVTIPNSVTSIGNYVFNSCTSLTSVTIPNSVTKIGNEAFSHCSVLTEIVIPDSVTSIGSYAFQYCTSLTEIVIPNSVTSIGDSAFSNCSGLTEIVISNSVTSIGNWVFNGCKSLTEIVIPDSVTSIGDWAFYNCYSLTEIVIPDSVTSIGDSAFIACKNLTSITCNAITAPTIGNSVFSSISSTGTLYYPCGSDYSTIISNLPSSWSSECFGEKPEIEYDVLAVYNVTSTTSAAKLINKVDYVEAMYVDDVEVDVASAYTFSETGEHVVKYKLIDNTKISDNAFASCYDLTSIEIGDSVTSIGSFAFSYCSGLTSIEIGDSITSIGTYAFQDCSGLTSIEIGNSVTSIGSYAFEDCSSLTSIIVDENNPKYDSRENCNSIIETETNKIIQGCSNSFIPNSVTSIGMYAFRSCSKLTSIEIPNSVTSIGSYVFYNCSGLTSITCNAITAPTITNTSFRNIAEGGTLTYPCNAIGYDAWMSTDDYYLGKYNWSSECFSNEIDYTFSATYNVRNINSLATLYSTYQPYFQDNIEKMYLNDVEIPISSTYQFPEIGEYTVKYKLKNTSLPDFAFYQIRTVYTVDLKDVTEIGLSCFENSFLKGELILGEKIERIGANAFEQTDITDVIIIPEFISCYNSRFRNCAQLTAVTSNEKFIWSSDFEGCGKLIITNLPNLEEIGQKAFSRCVALTSFTVPSTVKNISHKAFEDCTSLTEITFEMPTLAGVELGTNIFYDCPQHITIDYPCSADYEVLLNQIENYSTNCLSDQYDIKAVYQVLTPNEEIVLFNETNFTPYIEKMYVDNVEINLSTLIKVDETNTIGSKLVFAETGEHTVKYQLTDSCNFVENAAFLNVNSLVSVNLAKDFVSIGYNSFEQCVNLHTVKLPNSVEYVYNGAFYSCTSLTSVTLGEYVREIGWNAFERCHSLNFIEFMGTTAPTITSNSFTDVGASGMIIHPCGYNYNAIRAALPTWDCECDLYEITDFDVLALYEIDEASVNTETLIAFELSNINQIYVNEVPVGVVSAYTFNSAGQYLVKYKLVDNTTIKSVSGGTAFNKTLNTMFCSATGSLVNFTVKSACTKMYGVALMEGVRGIDQYSFAGCSGLNEVILPSSLTSVGNNAFNGCTSLDSVNMPNIESWCKISFGSAYSNPTYYTKKLYVDGELVTDLVIPNSVTSIRNYAFYNCTSLTSIVIPDSVTSIGDSAFDGCSHLSSIVIPNSVTSIGNFAFENCYDLTSVTFGDSVTSIGQYAFDSCSGLTEINIPDSVTSINIGAFSGCSSLASVTLGSGVTSISNSAFNSCSGLTEITTYATTAPTIYENTFNNVGSNGTLHYPCGSDYSSWLITDDNYLGKFGWTSECF